MQNPILALAAGLLLTAASAALLTAGPSAGPPGFGENNGNNEVMEITIRVTPAAMVVDSPRPWLFVHADILYSEIEEGSVYLNDVPAECLCADELGNLVARFKHEEIAALVGSQSCLHLKFTATTVDGEPVEGETWVKVRPTRRQQGAPPCKSKG